MTGGSWLFLGLIVGTLGYCPLTDWHFNILARLGKTNLPNSYVKYLADRLTGLNLDESLTHDVTMYSFIAALLLSIVFNIRDINRKKKS